MKLIQHRLIFLATLCIIGLSLSLIIYVNDFVIFRIDMFGFYALLILTSGLLVILLMREFGAYRIAKLIIENKIMSIEAAEINKRSYDASENILKIDSLEFFISCFGILLGSRVIKFNIDGVRLKKIEIGNDLICLAYGTTNSIKYIKLIHGVIDKNELKIIVERFRYETGIVPIIVD